jgi:hypothetical protein
MAGQSYPWPSGKEMHVTDKKDRLRSIINKDDHRLRSMIDNLLYDYVMTGAKVWAAEFEGHPDAENRKLWAMEFAEQWFEKHRADYLTGLEAASM